MASNDQAGASRNDDGDYGDNSKGPRGAEELATRNAVIQSKRFYLDVKQNQQGRFIKIAEVYITRPPGSGPARKNKIILPMQEVKEFRDKLTDFAEFHAQMDPSKSEEPPESGRLKSEVMSRSRGKQMYLDLKENRRGKFLRVSQTNQYNHYQRNQVAIPAQGIVDIRNHLSELIDEFGTDEGMASEEDDTQSGLPESKSLKVENKKFFFDVGSNNRGVFMKITETTRKYRSSITIPFIKQSRSIYENYRDNKEGWHKMADIIRDMAEEGTKSGTQSEDDGE